MTYPHCLLRTVLVFVVLGYGVTLCGREPPQTNCLVLEECSDILRRASDTEYTHKTHVVPEEGVYHLDCSGFLCYLLGRISPEALGQVPIEAKHPRQRAVTFHTAFSSAGTGSEQLWKKIPRLVDALPGDFIAWRKVVTPAEGNTGHCGVIWERPVREADGTIRVRILDSCISGHGSDRRNDPKLSGLGLGTMWFVVNAKGEPVGYHWASRSDPVTKCPVAVARLIRLGKSKASGESNEPDAGVGTASGNRRLLTHLLLVYRSCFGYAHAVY
jgi:hypothetical protein